MDRELEKLLPWDQPNNVYEDDGPPQDMEFELKGVRFNVYLSGEIGLDSMRTKYGVKCLSCNELLHPSTTSATIRVIQHMKEKSHVKI